MLSLISLEAFCNGESRGKNLSNRKNIDSEMSEPPKNKNYDSTDKCPLLFMCSMAVKFVAMK